MHKDPSLKNQPCSFASLWSISHRVRGGSREQVRDRVCYPEALLISIPSTQEETTRNCAILIGGYPRGMGKRMQGRPCRPNGTGWLRYRWYFIMVNLAPHILGKHSTSTHHLQDTGPTACASSTLSPISSAVAHGYPMRKGNLRDSSILICRRS